MEAYEKALPSHEWKFFDFSKNAVSVKLLLILIQVPNLNWLIRWTAHLRLLLTGRKPKAQTMNQHQSVYV